eukprot:1062157_1
MASSKAMFKSAKLIQEAQPLITQNAFDNNGSISAVRSKSETVLNNNKRGFAKLQKAAKLGIHWIAHFNLAEFYFSGLDGATVVNKTKAAQHYVGAWQIAQKAMCKKGSGTDTASTFEALLFNLAGILENTNLDTDQTDINTDQIIGLSKYLCKHSRFAQLKVFGHYIRGLVLLRMSKRAQSYIQYQKCVGITLKGNMSYYVKYVRIKAQEMMSTMDITNKGLNEQMMNNQRFVSGDNEYKKNFDRFQAQRNELSAQNANVIRNISGVDNEKLEQVAVVRTLDKDSKCGLITLDSRTNAVTSQQGNAAERKCNYCGKLGFDMKRCRKCNYCGKLGFDMKRCGKCKNVHYCDVKCQKPDWKLHKKICKK